MKGLWFIVVCQIVTVCFLIATDYEQRRAMTVMRQQIDLLANQQQEASRWIDDRTMRIKVPGVWPGDRISAASPIICRVPGELEVLDPTAINWAGNDSIVIYGESDTLTVHL